MTPARRAANLPLMFELVSDYQPAGDQPQAIAKLTEGVLAGAKHQVLLGVTGSGKTFTIANVIKNGNKPARNITLAAGATGSGGQLSAGLASDQWRFQRRLARATRNPSIASACGSFHQLPASLSRC